MATALNPFDALAETIANLVVEKLRVPVALASDLPKNIRLPAAAKIMGLSKTKLRSMITNGELGAMREGKLLLVSTAEIKAWMERTTLKR